jgi:bacterioferritin
MARKRIAKANDSGDGAIIALLKRAYNAELETVMNYLANSVHLDGVRAEQIKASLAADVTAELGHAQLLAKRIKTLGGNVPGSQSLAWNQRSLQPPKDTTDVVAVIKGVIEAEEDAIQMYESIIKTCEGSDYVSQDLAITILADEQEHRREFIGFLKEYQRTR